MRVLLAPAVALAACGDATIGAPPGGDPDGGATPDAALPPDAAAPDAAPPDAAPCTGGDARVVDPATGTCYVYVGATVTWSQAVAACEAMGAHLAVPTSAAEVALLTALAPTPDTLPDVWLGGTDAVVEGQWRWITAEPMVYTNWRTGEPNNGGGQYEEDCMILEADTAGTWDDRPCDRLYPSFCERP